MGYRIRIAIPEDEQRIRELFIRNPYNPVPNR